MNETNDTKMSSQTIDYSSLGDHDVNTGTSVLVNTDNVTVIPSGGDHTIGSSKVKMTNVVDYTWEQRFYTGQILAVHISGKYIAYGIQGKDSCNIRVISFATSDRALIKGIEGMAQDIAFAFILAPVLLACIDSVGDVYVYTIEENQLNALACCLMVHIKETSSSPPGSVNKIVWCPYVPDDEQMEDDDSSKLIVTRGNKAHLWNVTTINALHNIIPVSPESASEGFLEIKVDKYLIVDVAFSPEGTTVALACSDGGIRFYQVDEEGQSLVCIHDWRPHNGKPVSCLYFLDNHLESDAAFWKFAITGVEGNTEISIWSCESWTCLQTFKYAPISETPAKLKVAVDITASYILLSDMQRKLLHILQLKKNDEETGVRIHVISQFLLPYPILSFGIVKASLQNFNESNPYNYNDEAFNNANEREYLKTVIKLYLVQPKALQECNIVYDPDELSSKYNNTTTEIIDAKATALLNGLCMKGAAESTNSKDRDLKLTANSHSSISADKTLLQRLLSVSSIEDNMKQQKQTSDYNDVRVGNGDSTRRSLDRESLSHHVNDTEMNGCEETEDDNVVSDRMEEENGVVVNEGKSYYSTGSSPSREVQNILFSTTDNDEPCRSIPNKTNDAASLPVTVWPKIPIPEPENLCSDASGIMRINPNSLTLRNEIAPTDITPSQHTDLQAVYAKINSIQERLDQLTEQTQSQQQDLKQSVKLLHQILNNVSDDDKKKHRNVTNTAADERYLQERVVNAVTQSINSIMGNEVEYVIKEEINGNVLPSLKNSMDTFGQQMNAKFTQHFNVADQQLKDYIVKTVHKKSVTDALANTMASVLPSVISTSFAEAFCNIILPKFENSCHEMFEQVNNLFIEGTRDFVNILQSNVRSYEEKQGAILQTKIDEFMVKMDDMLKTASINAVKNVAPEIINPMKLALEEQKVYLENSLLNVSGTSTPPPFSAMKRNPEEHIEFLIKQGKVDMAIDQVLSASDLRLLVYLCEKLDPETIFAEPCTLQQHILLSFIQQLSADLNIQTDLKHRFIEGAVMCLDKKHPVCEKNFPKILPAVRGRISQYVGMNPTNKNTRNMKILLMAIDSLLDKDSYSS